jgi:hypothetical protein
MEVDVREEIGGNFLIQAIYRREGRGTTGEMGSTGEAVQVAKIR